ncbi:hypothetical protein HRI_003468100 [Hibiscus trionum]|uniref:Zinc finger CCCH domain-containing protein 44 n=1 Tax=Hibiscus trionum TaxID=183268 RepID=A0A9W7IPY1_HIBTR|nr:hypothetical protein HRI_003468100 [Hibiscus trionum]
MNDLGNADVVVRGDGGGAAEKAAEDGVKAVEMMSTGKRRRGRPPKNQARIMSSSAPPPNTDEEEDVCFICFDGGSLVLCDRRGCPKAYHLTCIKRDEEFFKSKAKWNCGWHICSSCQKASYYMCYTCTYSVCKNCTKDADYVNVRGTKGFCGTCMRTIMLIENRGLENKETVQVDFDDKTSWEYLFKVYWILLKEKLSLNIDELTKAKNPWEEIAIMGPNKRGNREKSFGDLGASSSKRRKSTGQENILNKVESLEAERTGVTNGIPFPEGINWATKELLEFVSHMRNGDTSVISRFDVQALLLEYITRSNLRDPCQKSYIVCDSMLIKLFGKARVGHFEMFKLLDSHFLAKDHSRLIDTITGGGSKAFATLLAVDRNSDVQPTIVDDKSCKTSIKVDGQSITVDRNSDAPQKGDDALSDIGSRETSIPPHSTGTEVSVNTVETDKIWHYQDPLGKIQGPFSMAMLHKWSLTGLFPPDLKIWRASEKQDDSILLTDAFSGQYRQAEQLFHNSCVPIEGVKIATSDGSHNRDGDVRESRDLNANQMENKQVEESSKSLQNDTGGHYCGNNEYVKSKDLGSQSSPCSSSLDIVNSNAEQMGSHLPHRDSVKGDKCFPGQAQVSSSLPSSTVSHKPCETESHQVSNGLGVERWDCGSIDMNEDLNKTSEGQIIAEIVKPEDNDRKSGKSCGQSQRSSPLNDTSNGWDLNSGLISLVRAFEASEHNQDIDFSNIPSSTTKLSNEDSKIQGTKTKQSLSLSVPHQDSGPSWSTVLSLVGTGAQLPEVAGEWDGYSSTPVKPSAEEWRPDLVAESSLKPTDLGNNHSATPTSGNRQLTHSPSTDHANNESGWEYPLADESVSDLLAEVEAMESLNGLPSPTSTLRSDGELAPGSDHDCFSPVGGLSPAPDPGKSNALSSGNNPQMPSQSTVTHEQFGVSQSEVLGAHRSSGGHSSSSPVTNEVTRPSSVSINQYEAGSDVQPPAPPVTWGMATVDSAWRPGPETTGTNLGSVQGNESFEWGGLGQGTRNVGRGGSFQENKSINTSTSAGHPPYWGSQQRYAGSRDRDFEGRDSSFGRGGAFQENRSINSSTSAGHPPYCGSQQRYVGSRDRDFEGRDSSFGSRGRYLGNRQPSNGGPNGVGSFRPPPKGQRVCKFYENGYCKKGASCSYWHR